MKRATIVTAFLVAAGLISASRAEASCQSICVRLFRACLADFPEDACQAELGDCLDGCAGGGSVFSKSALKDEGPRPRAEPRGLEQACVTEDEESTPLRALLALVPGTGDRGDVRASQAR